MVQRKSVSISSGVGFEFSLSHVNEYHQRCSAEGYPKKGYSVSSGLVLVLDDILDLTLFHLFVTLESKSQHFIYETVIHHPFIRETILYMLNK